MRYLGCLWVTARRTSRQRERVPSLGKMFGTSVGWFGGWAKSYVQVEYANKEYFMRQVISTTVFNLTLKVSLH